MNKWNVVHGTGFTILKPFSFQTLGLVFALSSLLQARGESASVDNTTIAPPAPQLDFVPVAREAHSTIWERTVFEQNPDGLQVPRVVRVTELATGLNYQDSSGQWVPSSTAIEPVEGGAVARQGQTKVWWANNLADQWPIQIESPTGKPIKARVLGIVLSG